MNEPIDLIRQICESQPEAVVWVQPVWDTESREGSVTIIDFEFSYCNAASEKITGMSAATVVGKRVLRDFLPDPGAVQLIFAQCLEVYQTGTPIEYAYYSPRLDKFLALHRVKVAEGVLTTVRNRTEEYRISEEKEQQAALLEKLVDSSPYGISLYESIRDKEGSIVDFRLKIANKRTAEFTGLTMEQIYGNTVKELMLLRGRTGYFDICKEVVETGASRYLEFHSVERDKWLAFAISKFGDGYMLNYIDITENKRLALQAAENASELDAIFNGSLSAVYSARVIKSERDKIQDLVFLRANESFYRIFQSTPEHIIGKSLLSISGDDSQSAFVGFAQEVMESGQPMIQVLHYKNPERWYEFSMVKLQEEIILVTVNDITLQRKAAIKIEEQKNLLDSILRHSPNGLAITEAIRDAAGAMVDARTILMNDACERYNGIPKEVMLANTYASLSPELLESDLFKQATQLETGASFRTQYELPNTGKWIELAVAKMDQDRFVNVFTDISEVKDAQIRLEQLVKELRASNSRLDDFAYAASHDLKEPIRKIMVFGEQLKTRLSNSLEPTDLKNLERLLVSAVRMKQLVDDLLEFARVNQGIDDLEEVDLALKAEKALEDLELAIREKSAIIHIGELPVVKGHKRQLQQVLQNLISNGIKYHKPGQNPEVWITARTVRGKDVSLPMQPAQLDQQFCLLEVRDNGIGFEQKDEERIFNIFTRLHSSSQYSGSGVGLSIVRKAVENHRGYLKVRSSPGEGATFSIFLPSQPDRP